MFVEKEIGTIIEETFTRLFGIDITKIIWYTPEITIEYGLNYDLLGKYIVSLHKKSFPHQQITETIIHQIVGDLNTYLLEIIKCNLINEGIKNVKIKFTLTYHSIHNGKEDDFSYIMEL